MFDDKKTLTKKEACQYLDIGREQFNSELNKGKIPFLTCGKRIKFTIEALEKWRSNTTNHIDFTSEEAYTTPTSRLYQKDTELSFENLLEQWNLKPRINNASTASKKLNRKLTPPQPAN